MITKRTLQPDPQFGSASSGASYVMRNWELRPGNGRGCEEGIQTEHLQALSRTYGS